MDSGEGVKPSLAKRKFRLSGWARLSIVIASLFWIAGTTLSLTSEFSRWDYECNWPDCPGYEQSRDVAYESDQQRPTSLRMGIPHLGSVEDLAIRELARRELAERELARKQKIELTEHAKNESNQTELESLRRKKEIAELRARRAAGIQLAAQAELNRRLFLQAEHQGRLIAAVRDPFLIATIVFLLLMLAKSTALWIWRGFKGAA